jgi:hypothetical protein
MIPTAGHLEATTYAAAESAITARNAAARYADRAERTDDTATRERYIARAEVAAATARAAADVAERALARIPITANRHLRADATNHTNDATRNATNARGDFKRAERTIDAAAEALETAL